MLIARAAGVVLAAVVCAWFALGIHQAHDTSKATSIISSRKSLSSAELARVDSLLSAAATLNPDHQVDLLRGEAAALAGERGRAAGIFDGLVRREPMNVEAWLLLAEVATDSHLKARAETTIFRLEPPLTKKR